MIAFLWIGSVAAFAAAPLNVAVSTPTLAAIARSVGGDEIKVTQLARDGEDPHRVKPRPALREAVSRADLVVSNGVALELAWLPHLTLGGAKSVLDVGKKIRPIEVPERPASKPSPAVEGRSIDTHPEGNPHYLFDPEGAKIAADAIAERLAQLRPAAAPSFRKNAEIFGQALEAKAAEWRKLLAGLEGKGIASYHRGFTYLVRWAGAEEVAQVETRPGVPPTAAELGRIATLAKERRARLILVASWDPTDAAQEVAKATGARVVVLPAEVGATPDAKTYFDLMDSVIRRIRGG